jgi:LPS-assembly protein
MAAEWTHRVPWGTYDIKASGIYQLDPMAFSFSEAQTHWRGAIQTTGQFRPIEDWEVGWSYTAFTDAAYLGDYGLKSGENNVNEIYATYLTADTYFDVRARQFNRLGDYTWAEQAEQTRAIPTIEAAKYVDLGEHGRIELNGEVLGVQRGKDSYDTFNGVPYVFAYEENKLHAMLEGAWQNQYILPGGVAATPYLGLRLDAGYFDRTDPDLPAPYPTPTSGVSLLSATPIAAMDVRWPLVATTDYGSHIFEPVAQIVYRGSSTTLTGITNDDAQSFVFDDTLLFSYNRFSGIDRQETGLRANIGGRYLANFDDGSWLQLIGGKSYHLAGVNALGIVDHAQTGNSSGLEDPLSYLVFGAQGSPGGGIEVGAKTQLDASTFSIMRATAAASYSFSGYNVGGTYTFIPANPAIGTVDDQHEATIYGKGPLPWDYWYADGSLSWDIAQNTWLESTAGITYDDGYFVSGVFGKITGPTHKDPNQQSFGIKVRLRGPVGEWGF